MHESWRYLQGVVRAQSWAIALLVLIIVALLILLLKPGLLPWPG